MLIFYPVRSVTDVLQELFQGSEVCNTDDRLRFQMHSAADVTMKHPLRNLQGANGDLIVEGTSKNGFVPCNLTMCPHELTEPRMPRITDFARSRTMGLVLSSCITTNDRTSRWTT